MRRGAREESGFFKFARTRSSRPAAIRAVGRQWKRRDWDRRTLHEEDPSGGGDDSRTCGILYTHNDIDRYETARRTTIRRGMRVTNRRHRGYCVGERRARGTNDDDDDDGRPRDGNAHDSVSFRLRSIIFPFLPLKYRFRKPKTTRRNERTKR